MKFDLKILQKYIDDGLIQTQFHPIYPLTIYNYTRECAFERKWDDITKICRGLILDVEGNVVALPLPKFFNLEELNDEEIPLGEDFEVFEKMDGSLGIIYYYANQWNVATRGSFTSDQAIKGKQMLDKLNTGFLLTNFTYLAEIIYPENRIVVDYGGAEQLVFLTSFEKYTGEENDIQELEEYNFNIVKAYNGITDFRQLKSKIRPDYEGFVIRFSPSGFRMKIKGEEYIRLHKLMTGISNKDIWEYLKYGAIDELLELIPDEMDDWVKKIITDLRFQYNYIEQSSKDWYKMLYPNVINMTEQNIKKQFALNVMNHAKHVSPILFAMYNKKDYSGIIWKYVKPKYQKPFFQQKTEVE